MKKKDLVALSGISQYSITQMGKNENVNTDVLVLVFRALNCDIGDIAESFCKKARLNNRYITL